MICLGVMKRMMKALVHGNLSKRVKLRASSIAQISQRIVQCANYFPVEFSRRPRGLQDLAHYKGTEFRNLVLYLGPHCFKGVLYPELYRNFLLFTSGIYILLSPKASDLAMNELANKLLRKFVKDSASHYGLQFVVYNVHNLIHISRDCLNYGSLDNFDAFGFETYMQTLKRYVRGKKHSLQQVVARMSEYESLNKRDANVCGFVNKSQRRKYKYKNVMFSVNDGDNCFLTKNLSVIVITGLESIENGIVKCKRFKLQDNVAEYPVDSRLLCIFRCKSFWPEESIDVKGILKKCVCLPDFEDGNYFICYPLFFDIDHM